MSYWTFTDLFEEPGPPPTPFQGGFGLLNREGIRKPAFFAYKYLHAAAGRRVPTTDTQAMVADRDGTVSAVLWDFEQPVQAISNRPFYTKVLPSHPAAPISLRLRHLRPGTSYSLKIYRTGYRANDAQTAYLEMGSPTTLSAAQLGRLSELTRDIPETKTVRTGKDGSFTAEVPMHSNDVVLVVLAPK